MGGVFIYNDEKKEVKKVAEDKKSGVPIDGPPPEGQQQEVAVPGASEDPPARSRRPRG